LAFALAGGAFSLNQFVGVWIFLALLSTTLPWFGRRGRQDLRRLLKSMLWFFAVATPVIVWSITSVADQAHVHFDYVGYLRDYYPQHFIVDVASPWRLTELCLLSLAVSVALLQSPLRVLVPVFVALHVVFLVGVGLPYLTNS